MLFRSKWPGAQLAGDVKINADAELVVTAGELGLLKETVIENNGVIRLGNGSTEYIGGGVDTAPRMIVADNDDGTGVMATLKGTGKVVLNQPYGSRVEVGLHSSLTQEAGHTIEGSGQLTGYWLVNRGDVIARDGTLMVTPYVHNYGTLGAAPGGVLEFEIGRASCRERV